MSTTSGEGGTQRKTLVQHQQELHQFYLDYMHGGLLELAFEVTPLDLLVGSSGDSWATRLIRTGANYPERIATIACSASGEVTVEHVTALRSLWEAFPRKPIVGADQTPFQQAVEHADIRRQQWVVDDEVIRTILASSALFPVAPQEDTFPTDEAEDEAIQDAIEYRYKGQRLRQSFSFRWIMPDQGRFSRYLPIIEAHNRCLCSVGVQPM